MSFLLYVVMNSRRKDTLEMPSREAKKTGFYPGQRKLGDTLGIFRHSAFWRLN
jgi:hypothetical protein